MDRAVPQPVALFRHPLPEGAPGSRALLGRAAAQFTGRQAGALGPVETGPWGKPYYPQAPQVQFSITHSGAWWLCAFSAQPLGLDLQLHRSHYPPAALARRFFHPLESRWLARRGDSDFFDLWCAKESWVKYTGRGFYDDPGSFSLVSPGGAFPAMEGVQLRLLPFAPEYSLCLCAPALGEVKLLELA